MGRLFLFILHFCVIVLCYTVFLNKVIAPSFFPYFEYVALFFPILIGINLLLILFWWFKNWLLAIFTMIFSIGLIFPTQNMVNLTKPNHLESTSDSLFKVMSYNVRYFSNNNFKKIDSLISKESPDVLFLQEFRLKQIEKLSLLKENEYYVSKYPYIGIASKYPIIETNSILDNLTNGHVCYADIKIKKDTLRFINIYLEPVYMDKSLFENASKERIKENGLIVKNLLEVGFKRHENQIRKIRPYIRNSPYPVILGGDFNSVPNSYEYFKLTENMNDAFVEAGNGLGFTFYDYQFPLRIDYIISDTILKTHGFNIIKKNYSDHYPISSTFYFPN